MAARLRRSYLGLFLSVGLLCVIAVPQPADGGHTIAGGDCWRSGTPFLCRTTWNSSSRIVDLKLYNQFTPVRPDWLDNAERACNRWHDFVASKPTNDIYCHWAPLAGATPVYLKTAVDGQMGLIAGRIAVTWNCNTSGICTNQNQALNIWYSEIYFNTSGEMDVLSEIRKDWAFAHEIGHALGLFHHSNTSYLMNSVVVSVGGPTAGDYGQKPPCSGATTTYGVRCIYNLSN